MTYIWQTSMSTHWAEFLLFIIVAAQFYCLTACVTSGSRMLFAFSRDRAVPGHQLWRTVSRHRVPVWSVAAVAVAGFLLLLPTYWNSGAGLLRRHVGRHTGLYIAFILPVILRYRQGDKFEVGAWSLGKHYKWINPIAILWVGFIFIVFMLPTVPQGHSREQLPEFNWNLANYAPLTIGGALLLFGGWWVFSANKWFKGPVRMGSDIELQELEGRQRAESSLPTRSRRRSHRFHRGAPRGASRHLGSRRCAATATSSATSSPTSPSPGTSWPSSRTGATSRSRRCRRSRAR